MNNEEIRARIAQRHAEELASDELGLWWLSFAEPHAGFLGVVILEAYGFTDALFRCRNAGLNHGGEVQGFVVDPDDIPEGLRNRLLKKKDLAGFGVSSRTGDKV